MIANRPFVLCYPGCKGFTSFSNIFGITFFTWELEDNVCLCIPGDGAFFYRLGRSMGSRRLVCYIHVVASVVSG